MGKLGDILKKDVGSIATKVLNVDVGDIVKSAGRALNTDVGTIAKGAGSVLTYDLGELFGNGAEDGNRQASDPSVALPDHPVNDQAEAKDRVAATTAGDGVPPAVAINTAAGVSPANAGPPPRAKLNEALVTRNTRSAPAGVDLAILMPVKVGGFSRSHGAANGEIASDPVSATYGSDLEAVTLTLTACWDPDEARDKLKRRQSSLDNARGAPDQSWAVGIDSHGIVFIWTREHYCYEIVSPRGVPALAGFLADFPF